ncbi:hypothetical protein KL930_003049 [Ogataea haglerorum]|uniref:uncharacterized protein n=1 Tax=Ogataea haglerorum TaxID=1937702 RepID=UPI001C8AE435|nr:uncharacterized protein KL911_002697 [Ogataea haglerorum]KAG7694692.1 hypothetical protein KL951_003869 [Ogataea haglerorum]KAG7704811.1 hypothetical protein KL950_003984 [Ogataea haglerorum]KAG7747576.1 hypothetical protein KL912_002948 [Ogataea haglerorum]KAG7753304.1 hypothetical protein KL911_002697 [Ogataea haglerorum]KAG7777375.1 hypothetical protein KL930_003049 [Ogataea haglerorum]
MEHAGAEEVHRRGQNEEDPHHSRDVAAPQGLHQPHPKGVVFWQQRHAHDAKHKRRHRHDRRQRKLAHDAPQLLPRQLREVLLHGRHAHDLELELVAQRVDLAHNLADRQLRRARHVRELDVRVAQADRVIDHDHVAVLVQLVVDDLRTVLAVHAADFEVDGA